MRPIRLVLGICSVSLVAVVFSAGGATGVLSLTDTTASSAKFVRVGERPKTAQPTMLERALDIAQRMAGRERAKGSDLDALRARRSYENSPVADISASDLTGLEAQAIERMDKATATMRVYSSDDQKPKSVGYLR